MKQATIFLPEQRKRMSLLPYCEKAAGVCLWSEAAVGRSTACCGKKHFQAGLCHQEKIRTARREENVSAGGGRAPVKLQEKRVSIAADLS